VGASTPSPAKHKQRRPSYRRGAGTPGTPAAGPQRCGWIASAASEFLAAYQRVRATVVEDWLDDMIEIVDHPDLDPLDKRVRIDHVARTRWWRPRASP
jgi:hypothetical protein